MADFARITALVNALVALKATLDLEDVNPPAVWVRLVTVEDFNLADGAEWGIELICVTEEKNPARAYPVLIAMRNQLNELVDLADGPQRFVTVNLPEGAAVPGLVCPYQLT